MTRHHHGRTVVVGVDGSQLALRAVRWGAAEAMRRDVPLRLMLAFASVEDYLAGHTGLAPRTRDILLDRARTCLSEAADVARQHAPGVVVEEQLVIGFPMEVLVDESRRAQLVVVGEQGLGRVTAALAGSVAVSVATHAACPVVVVRGVEQADQDKLPIVVGIDGSPVSEAALAFAYAAAAERQVPLVAVHTWWDGTLDPSTASDVYGPDPLPSEEAVLAERLAAWSAKYPQVPLQRVVAKDRPAHQLLVQSEKAQLVVVGSRGHGDLVGLVLGSVSNALVHRAACPVAVVRPEKDEQP